MIRLALCPNHRSAFALTPTPGGLSSHSVRSHHLIVALDLFPPRGEARFPRALARVLSACNRVWLVCLAACQNGENDARDFVGERHGDELEPASALSLAREQLIGPTLQSVVRAGQWNGEFRRKVSSPAAQISKTVAVCGVMTSPTLNAAFGLLFVEPGVWRPCSKKLHSGSPKKLSLAARSIFENGFQALKA